MLLTITNRGKDAGDMGYLLHKNPARPQTFELSYGKAHVFYPVAEEEVCTAALLLDLNPVELVRDRKGKGEPAGLFDYVNDRPYVASSFLSTAIARVFGTALSGRCDKRPELVDMELDLIATVTMLPCSRGAETILDLFEPLGYTVKCEAFPLDEKFPEWGDSRYFNVGISGKQRLCDLLGHLFVLIPVLDSAKHYWVNAEEIAKLLKHGEGWLEDHPMKEYIAYRYLNKRRGLYNEALSRIDEEQQGEEEEEEEIVAIVEDKDGEGIDSDGINGYEAGGETPEADDAEPGGDAMLTDAKTAEAEGGQAEGGQAEGGAGQPSLGQRRLGSVVDALKDSGARRVLDIGCGEGRLLALLLKEKQFEAIAGMDVSFYTLERAKSRLRLDRMTERQRGRIDIFQGSLNYIDKRLKGYDAIAAVEVIEHMDLSRLNVFEKVVFGYAAPRAVVLTTPNREYNEVYGLAADEASGKEGRLRHADHRFEWTRAEFREWAERVAGEYGYAVAFSGIGDADESLGAPTQMGVFSK